MEHVLPELVTMNHHFLFFELEDFFASARKCGFKDVELWTAPQHFFLDYHQHDPVGNLTRLMDTFDVRIMGLCPEQTNPKPNNMAAKEPSAQDRVFRYFTQAIDIAVEIGASQVLVTSGWEFYSEPLADARRRSIIMLSRLARYADRRKINLAIEALREPESHIANSIADLRKILTDVNSDRLKVCLDIGAMTAAGDTMKEYFETFENDIIHAHFVDGDANLLHRALGDGNRDLTADVKAFMEHAYQGVLSVECTDPSTFADPMSADLRSMGTYAGICADISTDHT